MGSIEILRTYLKACFNQWSSSAGNLERDLEDLPPNGHVSEGFMWPWLVSLASLGYSNRLLTLFWFITESTWSILNHFESSFMIPISNKSMIIE
jgi:hypothetical protein